MSGKIIVNRMLCSALAVSAIVFACDSAAQTNFPDRTIRVVVGFPAGSQVDTVARLLGQQFAEASGKPVVIENATGAAGNIAADRVARAAPDGYTLGLLGEAQLVVNPSLYRLAFDPMKDFAPVSEVTLWSSMLVVHNVLPVKSVKELVALAKAQPGGLTFASGGSGSLPHMTAELFKSMAGIDIRHIPYKGVVVAIPDLLGRRVTLMFSPIGIVLPLVREGKLGAVAVSSSRRAFAVPDVPTIAESGYPGFEVTGWYGLLAPASTPATIVRKLHQETVKALAKPNLGAKLADLGLEGIGNSPDEFAMVIKSEIPKWAKVITEMGIKPD
jgi:tripartite-type tricarboxylate transporter receptor subunit TctC